MDIRLVTRHIDRTQALFELAQRRAERAFSRFDDLVRSIEIRISDINGPRGGTGIACLARVRLSSGGDMLVEGSAVTPEAGVAHAIARLGGRVRRLASRRQDHG